MKPSAPFPIRTHRWSWIACLAIVLAAAATARAQVSPAEIINPQLRASESTYLHQLESYNKAIQSLHFPFPLYLTRYVNLDPQKDVATDTRGLEFVKFHDRIVLKITGVYAAAFSAARMTQNQRAARVFQDVVAPILELLPRQIPADVSCDAVGFEISYHVQTRTNNYDYEGKENLVVVLDKPDAFGYFQSSRDSDRQDILNRSEIYLSGKDFGLALGQKDPFSVEALDRSARHGSNPVSEPAAAPDRPISGVAPPRPTSGARLPLTGRDLLPGSHLPSDNVTAAAQATLPAASVSPVPAQPGSKPAPPATATQADADRIQAQYQSQLDALAKDGATQFHLVDYAPPSLVVFHGQVYIQLTLRNPTEFAMGSTSIYKRAAQSFDLFLAPLLKPLADKVPADAEIAGLDITVLNQLTSTSQPRSEALEFICPVKLLSQFTEAEITNQDLINQSTVLVNGVRIALDLQKVE
ncbi:MAG TPA: hypothetical protein VG028_20575 [Terriglobia bacterium]|nr:hypothetical protein [Terriglobia bacterium]